MWAKSAIPDSILDAAGLAVHASQWILDLRWHSKS